ncbi:EAL domain-containing protein [Pleomorphomonas sp. NRK KF1]|uniref:EAL domain-containing protein n=1 Tax=Pleomorphomonas sp. NRK KF1 TaxID=2943000 RepID=UPI0020449C78|nr:EAL domain-containing protein [Pleomorphomonas sp. NRK KF1]MCM5552231.1 EAL domain-containing protein [Pleomorphomonas sp. NRK KF1]
MSDRESDTRQDPGTAPDVRGGSQKASRLLARQLADATRPNGDVDLPALLKAIGSTYESLVTELGKGTDPTGALDVEQTDKSALVTAALDTVSEGIAVFDPEDRIVLWNRRYVEFYPELEGFLVEGRSFEMMLRLGLERGAYVDARGREEEWLKARLERHALPSSVEEQHRADGRWIRVEEHRTPDGGGVGIRVDISEFKRREAASRLLFEDSPVPMYLFDFETLRFLAVNRAAVARYGYTVHQFMNMSVLDIRPERLRAEALVSIRNWIDTQSGDRLFRHLKADGTEIDVEVFTRQQLHNGRQAVLVTAIDVTERKRASDELEATREFLDTIIENVPAALFAKDPISRKYILLNRAGELLFGCPREAFIGKNVRQIFGERVAIAAEAEEDELLSGSVKQLTASETISTPNGTRLLTITRMVVRNPDGSPRFIVGVTMDVTEKRRAEEQIAFLSHHDALTGLPNREAMMVRLADGIFAATATQARFGLLSVDIDRFKTLNDLYGHAVADQVLKETARRLVDIAGEGLVFRPGGDEFVMISNDPDQPNASRRLAALAQSVFSNDIMVDDKAIRIGISIGVATYPHDGDNGSLLLANAGAALYHVKSEARGQVRVYESKADQVIRDRWVLQADLGHALRNGELSLHFQPQAEINGRIFGFEALMRWTHPTRGAISPDEFIPLAEESNLILDMSEWVLEEACRTAASWTHPLTVAVNLSPIQFQHGELPRLIQQTLIDTGLPPSRLELEITEGILLGDFAHIVGMLRRIKAMGVRIAMDDFGTGYSSLSYLQAFPFDKIKIDKSFIQAIGRTEQATTIIRAVIGLCRGLGIPVIAEGVETEEQRSFLAQEHCPEIQGYIIGRPAPIQVYNKVVDSLAPVRTL